jgi:hypothetical protein
VPEDTDEGREAGEGDRDLGQGQEDLCFRQNRFAKAG